MKLYLDMCALKRPFDDQAQERVALETHAVLAIMGRIERGLDTMIWSTALTFENDADPEPEPRSEIALYAARAVALQALTPQVEQRIREFTAAGVGPLDAAHLAFAEAAAADMLITCDDGFARRAKRTGSLLKVLTPIEYLNEVGDD
jgi:hypothetical protein